MKHLSSLFILLHLPAIECLAGDKQDWTTNTLAPGLTIQMPPRFRMTRRRPTGDFDLIVFKKDSRTVLTVYVGNQPEFPREKVRCSIKEATINGLRTESTIIKRPDRTTSREVLFHLRDDSDWPQRLHCWYAGSSAFDSAEADKIISTVRLADKPRSKSPTK